MTNYTKKALKNVVIVFVISIVAAFIGYFVRIFFARNLTVEEFGLFYATIAFLGFFSFFKGLGLDTALAFFIPKFTAKSEFQNIKNSIIYASIVLLVNNIIFLIIILIFAKYLGVNFLKHDFGPIVLILMAISLFVDSFVLLIKSSFQGFQKMGLFSSVDIIRMILILAISLIFFKMDYGILSPVIAYIITSLILLFVYFPFLYKNFDAFTKNKFFWDKPLFKRLRKYGIQVILISSVGIVIGYSDQLMITYFRGLEEVGIYSAVLPTAMLTWYITSAIGYVLLPITSELWNKGMKTELKKGIGLLYRFSLILILPVLSLLIIFSSIILELFYGSNYVIGSMALKILAIGIMFHTFQGINGGIFSGIGEPGINTKIIGISAILNIFFNFLLIPKFGFTGAAVATAISYLSMALLGLYILKKKNLIQIPYIRWIKNLAISIVFLLIVNYLNLQMTMNLFVKIPLILLVSGAIYVISLFIWGLVTVSEVKELLRRLRAT
ncbi:flippase [Candidatus Woesearchaeota archaeon]|nr:flippase [Candidatus Woesearchaeota archaeon]